MDDQILAIYCLCDDVVKALHPYEDPQRQMTDAEVMTTAIVAARFFGGNFERARELLASPRYIPNMLSKSRLCRRLHAVTDLLLAVFRLLGETFKQLNTSSRYVIDSFPVPVCDNIRIKRTHLYPKASGRGADERFRGYTASKRRFFFGLKLFVMVTSQAEPVEMFLVPGSTGDVVALDIFDFNLPEGSQVAADSAFTIYAVEDLVKEAADIDLRPERKKNSKRPVPGYVAYLQTIERKIVETSGSILSTLLPKSIHAVTARGFELKVMLFVLAYSVSRAL